METNWIILAIVCVCAIALILWLIIRNLKDKKDIDDLLNSKTDIEDKSDLDKEDEY